MAARVLPIAQQQQNSASDGGDVLIGLGSNAVDGYSDYSPDRIAGARMESGLDNSPMVTHCLCRWTHCLCLAFACVCAAFVPKTLPVLADFQYDCGKAEQPVCTDLFHAATGQMQLVDVGMTSMVISEAEHLASLAEILVKGGADRSADVARLRATAATLRRNLAAYTWDGQSKAFINRYPSGGGFYHRVSPTR